MDLREFFAHFKHDVPVDNVPACILGRSPREPRRVLDSAMMTPGRATGDLPLHAPLRPRRVPDESASLHDVHAVRRLPGDAHQLRAGAPVRRDGADHGVIHAMLSAWCVVTRRKGWPRSR